MYHSINFISYNVDGEPLRSVDSSRIPSNRKNIPKGSVEDISMHADSLINQSYDAERSHDLATSVLYCSQAIGNFIWSQLFYGLIWWVVVPRLYDWLLL